MTNFEDLLKEIKNKKLSFHIYGKTKQILSMAQYRSKNLRDNEYIKILFNDKSFLVVSLKEKLLMYSDKIIGRIKNIKNQDIGEKETIIYQNKKYKLVNKNDHQQVKKLLFGDFSELEDEVFFSDYEAEDGSVELLSLGWLVKDQKRADMHVKELKIEDINLLSSLT
jgi:hypothetical protein